MAQLLVRNLDLAVKEEVRVILRRAVESDDLSPLTQGLGSRIAALFAEVDLEPPERL